MKGRQCILQKLDEKGKAKVAMAASMRNDLLKKEHKVLGIKVEFGNHSLSQGDELENVPPKKRRMSSDQWLALGASGSPRKRRCASL